mmetsp:Transcript_27788/g.26842  ORF Transcript_27788/g.26842 Transcript_27788/m.26842 type:complete len:208 (+) Transcript_27788:34-657(+)
MNQWKPSIATCGGFRYCNQDNHSKQIYLRQLFSPFLTDSIKGELKHSFGSKLLQQTIQEHLKAVSLKLSYQLKPTPKEVWFYNMLYKFDHADFFWKISSRSRRNQVDTNNMSAGLMEKALNHDVLYSSKVGFQLLHFFAEDEDPVNELNLKLSAEYASNSTDIRYAKGLGGLQWTKLFDSGLLNLHLSAGYIHNLNDNNSHDQANTS